MTIPGLIETLTLHTDTNYFNQIKSDHDLWETIHFVMDFSGEEYPFCRSFDEYDEEWFDINRSDFLLFLKRLENVAYKFTFLKKYSLRKLQEFLRAINEDAGELKYCIQTTGEKIGEKVYYFKDTDTDTILATFILVEFTELNQQITQCIYLDKTINAEY